MKISVIDLFTKNKQKTALEKEKSSKICREKKILSTMTDIQHYVQKNNSRKVAKSARMKKKVGI